MRLRLLTPLILLAATLDAQETVHLKPPPAPPVPRGRVTGKVLCNDTRQPARGAMVMLQPMPSKDKADKSEQTERSAGLLMARVGIDGSYTIEHLGAGDYALVPFFAGYLSPFDGLVISEASPDPETEMRGRLSSANLIHITRDSAQTADLMLERGASVTGRVLYSDGAPATQNNIELEEVSAKPSAAASGKMSMDMGAMMRSMFTHQSLSTDDTGHFRVAGIRPGTYRIVVTQPISMGDLANGAGADSGLAMGLMGGVGDPHAMRFYAGDTLHRKAAKTYELRAGDTVDGLDIRIPIDGFHPVRVRLSTVDGRPLTGATVTMVDTADDSLVFTAANRQDGLFIFSGIPAGTYAISAKSGVIGPQYGPATAAFADGTAAVIVKDSDPADILLSLTETALPKLDPKNVVPED